MSLHRSTLPVLLVLSALPAACDSVTSGDSRDAECAYEPAAASPDEVMRALGFSLAQLRSTVAGERQAPLRWVNADPTVLETFPPPQETQLTMTVTPTGEPRFLAARRVGGRDNERLLCLPAAEIAADVRFTTADGGFDESWSVVLRASGGTGGAPGARFSVDLLAKPVKGSFRAAWRDLRPGETQALQLSGEVSAAGSSGTVDITRMIQMGNMGEGSGTSAARWGNR
jgi:hypothetical protein